MKKITILFLSALALGSCSGWLDVTPRSEVKQEHLFRNEAGFRAALYGVYLDMGERQLYGDNLSMGFLDVLGQYYTIGTSENSFYEASRYNYGAANVKSTIGDIWNAGYEVIANINNMLDQLEKKDDDFFSDPRYYGILRGEGLALRALIHFDLLRLFAPSPAAGLDAEGIPFVESVSKTPSPQLTVRQMIGRCLDELEEASELLYEVDPISPHFAEYEDSKIISGDWVNQNSYINDGGFFMERKARMNYLAVRALMARIELYGGNATKAAEYAYECLESGRFGVGENLFALHQDALSRISESHFFSTATISSGLLLSEPNRAYFYESQRYGADKRLTDYFTSTGDYLIMSRFTRKATDSEISKPQYMSILSASEVYLIYAECASSQTDRYDYLNDERAQFALVGNDRLNPADNPDLQNELYKEYRKRFIGEGQIFYYMKRTGMTKVERAQGEVIAVNPGAYSMMDYLPENEYHYGNIKQ